MIRSKRIIKISFLITLKTSLESSNGRTMFFPSMSSLFIINRYRYKKMFEDLITL